MRKTRSQVSRQKIIVTRFLLRFAQPFFAKFRWTTYWSHYLRVLKLSLSGDKLYEKRKAAALEVEVRARNAIINNNTS